MAAGKLLTEFKEHTGGVNAISFHPQELLLASAGQDRCGALRCLLAAFTCLTSPRFLEHELFNH